MIIGDSVILGGGGGGGRTLSIEPTYDEWQHNTWVTLRVDIDAAGNLSIRQSSGGGTTTGLRICYPQGSDTTITKIPDIPTQAGTYTLPITAVWSGDSNDHTLTYTVVESGGSRFAAIVVTAPTGSTVTMSHGGETTTGIEVSGTWTFKAQEYGTYTVTATKDGQTDTKSILVDAATEYAVELRYITEVTITVSGYSISQYSGYVSYNGHTYSSGSVTIPIGSYISLRTTSPQNQGGLTTITLNGASVGTVQNISPYGKEYTFAPMSDVNVVISTDSITGAPILTVTGGV